MRPKPDEAYNIELLYSQLPELDQTLKNGDTSTTEKVAERLYSELVDFGLHSVQALAYQNEDQRDLDECIHNLTTQVVQYSMGNMSERRKKNYDFSSQNILLLHLITRLLEDQEVCESLKYDLLQRTLFFPFDLNRLSNSFPTANIEEKPFHITLAGSVYNRLLPRIIALSKSSTPLESQWAAERLLEIKEAIYSLEAHNGEISLDVTPDLEITEEEIAFFRLPKAEREVHLFKKNLMAEILLPISPTRLETLFLSLIMELNNIESKFVAKRKLFVLIEILKEKPELFNFQIFISLLDRELSNDSIKTVVATFVKKD